MRSLTLLTAAFAALILSTPVASAQAPVAPARDCSFPSARAGRYAEVNGLRMYYEVHGTGRPLVLIHGALTTIQSSFAQMIPTLACGRQVIAVELQAHGRTADIARTFSNEQSADDVAALLRQLRIEQADILGYSMGGATALRLAVRHPSLVRRLVIVSSGFSNEGMTPELRQFMASIDPQNAPWADFWKAEFQRVALRPEQWPQPLVRIKESVSESRPVTVEQIAAITSPTLLIAGDKDIIPLEHLAQFYRALRNGQLFIIPGTDHYPGIVNASAQQLAVVVPFLDAN